jgi:hypothetical protein
MVYMMKQLDILSTKLFTHDKVGKMFITDVSDLIAACPWELNLMQTLYTDDGRETSMQGFKMKSHQSGKEVQVFFDTYLKNGEGEVQAWVFKFVPLQMWEYRIVIYND